MNNKTYMHVGRAIEKFHPEVLKEILPRVEVPEPVFTHTVLLPQLLDAYCETQQVARSFVVGVYKGKGETQGSHEHKKLFIAVILKLYNPEALTGVHDDKIKGHLCAELGALLGCKREQVSQFTSDIKRMFNPVKHLQVYRSFQRDVESLAGLIKTRVTIAPVQALA